MDGCFPTALGRQSTILMAAVYPWESWSEFLVAGCPSSHQPTRIREETLDSGGPFQRKYLEVKVFVSLCAYTAGGYVHGSEQISF
jgi:hypothetical protein